MIIKMNIKNKNGNTRFSHHYLTPPHNRLLFYLKIYPPASLLSLVSTSKESRKAPNHHEWHPNEQKESSVALKNSLIDQPDLPAPSFAAYQWVLHRTSLPAPKMPGLTLQNPRQPARQSRKDPMNAMNEQRMTRR